MNKYKKIALTMPLIGILSVGFVTPLTSFAATPAKTFMVDPLTQKITQISEQSSNTLLDAPLLSRDPDVPAPDTGKTTTIASNVDALTVDRNVWVYRKIEPDSMYAHMHPGAKYYRCETNFILSTDKDGRTPGLTDNTVEQQPLLLANTKLQQEAFYKLIVASTASKSTKLHLAKTITYGISQTESEDLTFTLGIEAGAKASTGALPGGEVNTKISESIATHFGTSMTISDSSTISATYDFDIPPADYLNEYNRYQGALYQVYFKYSIAPDSTLQNFLNTNGASIKYQSYTYKAPRYAEFASYDVKKK